MFLRAGFGESAAVLYGYDVCAVCVPGGVYDELCCRAIVWESEDTAQAVEEIECVRCRIEG